ncbi:hypothetical protein [Candidatus Viadribacter manganicus]|uniref:Uncharacterized protein n=1 Tax=Candidatus Viadribacter manganicus TaxID=1759059 RepID=A0A1B1AEF7_9PROT|nr:hypothetical protein [Candidatus Viadribacter manganicus]ANP44937.1 hypothetical protein ATE48_02855 [Candidatus Viadribacter manganicus]
MILRRIIAHLRKQEWTAIGIDFLIVVLGVFLGIQVSNWNEAAASRRAESAYLSQLRGDLQRIEGEVRDQIEFEQFQGRLAGKVFYLIENDRTAERSRRIGVALSALTQRRTLRTESPTFVDLQSSGNLEIISDAALRAEIISYFFYTRRLEAVIDKNNIYFVDEAFVPFMRNSGLPARAWDDQLMGMALLERGRTTGAFRDEVYAGPLFQPQSLMLANAPSAPSWAPVVTQLTWRAHVAAVNESTAQRLLDATSRLEARIARQLDRRRL